MEDKKTQIMAQLQNKKNNFNNSNSQSKAKSMNRYGDYVRQYFDSLGKKSSLMKMEGSNNFFKRKLIKSNTKVKARDRHS